MDARADGDGGVDMVKAAFQIIFSFPAPDSIAFNVKMEGQCDMHYLPHQLAALAKQMAVEADFYITQRLVGSLQGRQSKPGLMLPTLKLGKV